MDFIKGLDMVLKLYEWESTLVFDQIQISGPDFRPAQSGTIGMDH